MNHLSKIAVFALVILLFAPALKSRFGIDDLLIYFVPFAIFLLSNIMLNVLYRTYFFQNLASSFTYFLLLSPVLFAFFIGDAQELGLLTIVAVNCTLAAMVVVYPWNHRSLHLFFFLCSLIGAGLAIHTLVYLGSNIALELASEEQKKGYITVSVAIGFGCLASLYLVFSKTTPLHILILATNWLGLASGRARGAFAVCVIISLVYVFYVLKSKHISITVAKKYVITGIAVLLVPIVAYKLLSIDTNKNRWTSLVSGFSEVVDDGGRGPLMREALDKIERSPIIGNGLGEYKGFYGHPHNVFLQFGVDAGMVGILFLLAFLIKVSHAGLTSIYRHSRNEVNMACVALCFFYFMLGNMMTSVDAYLGREFFIASALPVVMFQIYRHFRVEQRH